MPDNRAHMQKLNPKTNAQPREKLRDPVPEDSTPNIVDDIAEMPQMTIEEQAASIGAGPPNSLTLIAQLVTATKAVMECFPHLDSMRIFRAIKLCVDRDEPIDVVVKKLRKADDAVA